MSRRALATISVSLSLSLSSAIATGNSANAQATNDSNSASKAASNEQWVVNPTTGIGSEQPRSSSSPATAAASGAPPSSATPGGTSTTTSTVPSASSTSTAAPIAGAAKTADAAKPATKKKVEMVVVQESPLNVATKQQWSKFDNWVSLPNGQDQLPLTLTFTNTGFSALRIMISGRQVATEKDFKDGTLAVNVGNALGAGDSQIVLQGYGEPGAKIAWKLTTPRPILNEVKPDTVATGQKLTLNGRYFSTATAIDVVSIGGKLATVQTASAKSLVVTVPADTPAGEQSVYVKVGGIETKSQKVKILPVPEVSTVDFAGAPPGQPITVTGKGFSTKVSDNSVTINGVPAEITGVTDTSISFIMPNCAGGDFLPPMPIVVKSMGVEAKGKVEIMPGVRTIKNEGGTNWWNQ